MDELRTEYVEKCRLCVNDGDYNIFEHKLMVEDEELQISAALQCFSELNVENSTLSNEMCKECTQELGFAYNFYKKVEISEKDLIKALGDMEEDADILRDEINEEMEENQMDGVMLTSKGGIMMTTLPPPPPLEPAPPPQPVKITQLNMQKTRKAPTFQLTSNVSSILSKLQTNSSPGKRKNETSEEDEVEMDSKRRKLDVIIDSDEIPTSGYIRHKTKSPASVTAEEEIFDNDIIIESSSDLGLVLTVNDECLDDDGIGIEVIAQPQSITAASNRKQKSTSPQSKVTAKVAAFTVDPKKLNSVYSSLDKKSNTSVLYQCTYCEKAFATIYHLGIHNKKAHLCQHCLQGFLKPQDLFAHIRAEHSTFKCTICNKILSTNSNLRAHVRKIHNVTVPPGVSVFYLNNKEDDDNDE